MSVAKLPSISDLPRLSVTDRAAILDLLFEPSSALHTLSLPLTSPDSTTSRSFTSYDDLIVAVSMQLTELAESASASDTAWLDQILGSHPRLGANKVDSALSRQEQAAMIAAGGEQEKQAEAETLAALNEEYERAFPGLRYVVFVNGRPRRVIFEDMRRRIARADIQAERREAIQAMCDIASDRARKLQ